MNSALEIILGLVLVIISVLAVLTNFWQFGTSALVVFKGGLAWIVFLAGLLILILGISNLKN